MALRQVNGDVVLASAARGSGTYTSGALGTPGAAMFVVLMVHTTAVSGTGPTLNVSLEQSNDGSTWSAVANSGIAQQTAVGNALAAAVVTDDFVRVTATVGGTIPSFTFSVAALTFAE